MEASFRRVLNSLQHRIVAGHVFICSPNAPLLTIANVFNLAPEIRAPYRANNNDPVAPVNKGRSFLVEANKENLGIFFRIEYLKIQIRGMSPRAWGTPEFLWKLRKEIVTFNDFTVPVPMTTLGGVPNVNWFTPNNSFQPRNGGNFVSCTGDGLSLNVMAKDGHSGEVK